MGARQREKRQGERERETSARHAILSVGTNAARTLTARVPKAEKVLSLTSLGRRIKVIARRRILHPEGRDSDRGGASDECCRACPIVVSRPAKAMPAVVRPRAGRVVCALDGVQATAAGRPRAAFGSPRAAGHGAGGPRAALREG